MSTTVKTRPSCKGGPSEKYLSASGRFTNLTAYNVRVSHSTAAEDLTMLPGLASISIGTRVMVTSLPLMLRVEASVAIQPPWPLSYRRVDIFSVLL